MPSILDTSPLIRVAADHRGATLVATFCRVAASTRRARRPPPIAREDDETSRAGPRFQTFPLPPAAPCKPSPRPASLEPPVAAQIAPGAPDPCR